MKKPSQSLNNRLFLWYIGSLFLMGIFVFLVIHVFALKNGIYFLLLVFITLALLGFTIIYKITKSLTRLSSQMKQISSKNLDERVEEIESEDEIGELADTFNDLLDRLHQAFKREQQFIADVAHELKTPLSTLRTTLEVALQQKRDADDYQKTIKESLSETHRVSSTLKNVLDLAWSETPQEQKNLKLLNLSSLVEELLETAQKMGVEKKLSVTGSIDKKIFIQGSQEKLGRAILNIVDNAIKYTPLLGKIEINLTKQKHFATLSIKDNGVGISTNDLHYIFDRFYRGSSSGKTFGSGLGLAIAKAIVSSHKGEIKVKSRVGKGSIFTIGFPLT